MFWRFNFFSRKNMKEEPWSFLKGITLDWKKYKQTSSQWDHEHCEFCGGIFMEEVDGKIFNFGWTDESEDHWICSSCFDENEETYQFQKRNSSNE